MVIGEKRCAIHPHPQGDEVFWHNSIKKYASKSYIQELKLHKDVNKCYVYKGSCGYGRHVYEPISRTKEEVDRMGDGEVCIWMREECISNMYLIEVHDKPPKTKEEFKEEQDKRRSLRN